MKANLFALAAIGDVTLVQAASLIVNVVDAQSQIIEPNIGCVTSSGRVAKGNCGSFTIEDGKLKSSGALCTVKDATQPPSPKSQGTSFPDYALTCKTSYTSTPDEVWYQLNGGRNYVCTGNLGCSFDLVTRPTSPNDQAILFRYWSDPPTGVKVALTFQ